MYQSSVSTDDLLRELASHGTPQFPIRYYLDDSLRLPDRTVGRHWHTELECVVIGEGCADYRIGDRDISLGQG